MYLDEINSEAARIYELERPTMERQAMAMKEAEDEAQLQLALTAGDKAALDNFLGQKDRGSRGTHANGQTSHHGHSRGQQHSRSHGRQHSSSHGRQHTSGGKVQPRPMPQPRVSA